MKVSTKGRYGLRAMLDLALNDNGGEAVCVHSISQRQNISESYLEQLVRKLRKAGLIESVRGAGGGYRLARPAADISVGDILKACEGSIKAVTCGLDDTPFSCGQQDRCATKIVWDRVNDAIEGAVDSISLEQLVEKSRTDSGEEEIDTSACVN